MSLRGSAVFAVTFGTPSTRKFVEAVPMAAPTDAFGRLTRAVSCPVPGTRSVRFTTERSCTGRIDDLLLRHDGAHLGPRRLDDRRFTGDRHRFLQRLDTHRDVLRILEADREDEVLHLNRREALELGAEVVAAWRETGRAVPTVSLRSQTCARRRCRSW